MEAQQRAEIGRRLRELRGVRTQQPIADYVGVTLRAYQAWEAGHSGISWAHLKKLARYFGASENYLLYGDEQGPGHRQEQLDRIETKLDALADRLIAALPVDPGVDLEQELEDAAEQDGQRSGGTEAVGDDDGSEGREPPAQPGSHP